MRYSQKIPNFDEDTIILSSNMIDSRNYRTATIDEKKGQFQTSRQNTKQAFKCIYIYRCGYIKNYKKFTSFLENMSVEIENLITLFKK